MNVPPKLFGGVRFLDGEWNSYEYISRLGPENVRRLDTNALPIIIQMQRTGIAIDPDYFVAFGEVLEQREQEIIEGIHDMTGYYVNPRSGDQVAEFLFRKLKIKTPRQPKLTDTGREEVDADALKEWTHLHPSIKLIRDARECAKLKGTYSDKIPTFAVRENGAFILHPRYKHTRVPSGRLACADPNLMAIPTRSDWGKGIRSGFIPRRKGHVLGTVDMSQIEMRGIAHDSNCWNMLDIFIKGPYKTPKYKCKVDFYWGTAELMYHKSVDDMIDDHGGDVDKAKGTYRFNAKECSLMIGYRVTPQGLLDNFIARGASGWDLEKCETAMSDFFKAYPEIAKRWGEHDRRARMYGFEWDAFGRIRYATGVRSIHPWIWTQVLREVGNHPVQSLAQGGMKLTMAEVEQFRSNHKHFSKTVWPLLQIHDELLFEAESEQIWCDFYPHLQKIISNCMPLLCPISSSEAHSDINWGELEK